MKIGKIFRRNEEEMKPNRKFEVIDGGKAKPKIGDKGPPPGDWLTPLADNTVFLARSRNTSDPLLNEFTIIRHSENAVRMRVNDQLVWFDPGRFCTSTDLVDVLHYGREEE